ncbi:hypothetical protein [Amycolatopsis sp. NPDC058986]|uniref:hypothetical protein n=1 Tax=unclassified Amycolatopsis TaxID=2618356 RepID=UPI00366AD7EB
MRPDLPLEQLASIQLADIVTYLRATGWQESGTYSRSVIWKFAVDDGDAEVLVPAVPELRDYANGVSDVVETLALVEGRPPQEIVRDLRSSRVDVHYIRTVPDGPSGTIPLPEGLKAVQGTHDLLMAAATSTVSPTRPSVLPSNKPDAAKAIISTLRLGQTSVGSYVLRVESPLPEEGVTPLYSPRDALLHLHQAAASAREAAELSRNDDYTAFVERIGDGVSANLCEALANVGGQRQSTFELSFSWALDSPVNVETPLLRFDSRIISVIKRGGKFLRKYPTEAVATVIGRVVDLHRTPTDKLGKVQLAGVVEVAEKRRAEERIVLRLGSRDYDLALAAHRDGNELRVTGSLRHTGRQSEIIQAERVEILPKTDQ